MSINIYIGNLPYLMTESELEDLFLDFGDVESVKIVMDRRSGRSKGFGFIEMTNREDGEAAIEKLDNHSVHSRNIKVNEAKPRENRENRPRRNDRRRNY